MARRSSRIPPFRKIKKVIRKHVNAVVKEKLEEFAWELRGYLVDGIMTQRFDSFKEYPLKRDYKERKIRKGLDSRVLIATGQYANSITVIKHAKINFEVNVPEDAVALDENRRPTQTNLRWIGSIHEYGSARANIPARSHWRVVIREARKRAPKVAKSIANEAARRIRSDIAKGIV